MLSNELDEPIELLSDIASELSSINQVVDREYNELRKVIIMLRDIQHKWEKELPLQSSGQDNMNKIAGSLKETFSSILDPNRCELCPDINTSGNNVTCNIYHTVIPDINKHPSWCKMKGWKG